MVRLTGVLSARPRSRQEDGAVAILVAVLATALFVLAAFVVDLGFARDVRRQAQNAADAASLAAGNVLYGNSNTPDFDRAVQAAKDYAEDNYGVTESDWSTCTDGAALRHTVDTPCISFQSSTSSDEDETRPDTVRVRIPTRTLRMSLGRLAGVDTIDVASEAEAALSAATVPQCALCVLGTGTHDLQNGDVEVNGGDVHFNGSVSMNPNGSVTTDGTTSIQGTWLANKNYYPTPPVINQPAVSDPLAFMPMPSWDSLTTKSNPCTDGEGIYGSFSFPNSTCTLAPGLYVIAGADSVWNTSGTATVQGTGVTLYFTCGTPTAPTACATGGNGASLDMAGSSKFSVEAPTDGALEGLAVVYDRNNNDILKLVGSSGSALTGTIYAPSATLQMNGNGCISAMRSMIVVKSVTMNGDPACLKSDYALSTNVNLPPEALHLSW